MDHQMGSLSLPNLPVIDFSEESLRPGTDSWLRTRENVRSAFEKYGAFEATYNKLSLDIHNAILHEMEGLFDLPHDVKVKNTSEKPFHGYIANPAIRFEGLAVDNATSLESFQSFAKLMWTDVGNEPFCDAALSYSKTVSELERLVKKMLFESYDLAQEHYDSHVDSTTYLLRFIKYPPHLEENETEVGCGIHTDKGIITILHNNEVSGLEVQTNEGDWIGYEPSSPTSFVVMAGDGLMAWSNGRIHAPPHRVVTKGGIKEARYTLAMFTFHTGIVQILPELVDDGHPLQYKDFEHYGLLRYFATVPPEEKSMSMAKVYCGI